jgi:hypothetical protein
MMLSPSMLLACLPLTLIMTAAPFTQAQSIMNSPPAEDQQAMRSLRDLKSCRNARYGECGSDCNQDCDCNDGLVCYLREEGSSNFFKFGGARNLNIPGCAAAKDLFNDYCIDPNKFPAKTLWYIGERGVPSKVYPMKECWGDCDKDSDWYVVTCATR